MASGVSPDICSFWQPDWNSAAGGSVHFHIHYTLGPTPTNSVKWRYPMVKKIVLHLKYFRHLYQTTAIVFTSTNAIERTKFHFSSTIIGRISLFVNVIYPITGLHCADRPAEEWITLTQITNNEISTFFTFWAKPRLVSTNVRDIP